MENQEQNSGWSWIGSRGKAHYFKDGKCRVEGKPVNLLFSLCDKYSMSSIKPLRADMLDELHQCPKCTKILNSN